MGVAPLPKLQTLYLCRVITQPDSLSIGELGRLHFTSSELRRIQKEEKEKVKAMALGIIDISTLPVREFGRTATEPRISITEGGQFMFNVLIKKAWEVETVLGTKKNEKGEEKPFVESRTGVEKLLVRFDPDTRMLAFNGMKKGQLPKGVKEESLLSLKISSDGEQISAPGAGILTQLKYEYAKAGNQNFEAKFDEKLKAYTMILPKETPAKKPVTPRKAKPVVAANGANGAIKTPVEAPAEEELLDLA
jgi:hypothetical protein